MSDKELLDDQYAAGYRDGFCFAITELIELIETEDQEYIFSEIENEIKRHREIKRRRDYQRRWDK